MSERKDTDGKRIRTDPDARSGDPKLPAFLARPKDAPVYHGFPRVEESVTDGWCYGTISDFEDPDGCEWGDGYVIAPDGTRAGIAWSVGTFPLHEICAPTRNRWGVYGIAVPRPIRTVDDMVACFRAVLPELKALHAKIVGSGA